MEARELRIGNIVGVEKHNDVFVINAIEDVLIKVAGRAHFIAETTELKPIPLTDEWLIKLGFKARVIHICWAIKGFPFVIHFEENAFILYYNNEYEDIEIKYVHQIQNLYFALTGQELTINETT